MPGLIGNLFTPEDDGTGGGTEGGTEGASQSSSNSTDIATDGSHGLDLSPSVAIEMGGSYEELDGSTTTWSNTTTLDLDVGAQIDHAASLGLDDMSDSGG